ncbi:hypothetical protein EW026_g5228 [Hermanssonia centrifuga]|uniref:Uncharacterized protein n=1 Tax=Hermanssonia centrifuga TaxID=98765 RepID=A0A4S4KFN9_9APHY|nr:hypothetical protein EW026_g5228 [Hermanssonia centrifuga]
MAPILTRYEKLIMRTSERKDVFIEKFEDLGRPHVSDASASQNHAHKTNDSVGSHSSFEEGILIRMEKDRGKESDKKGPASSTTSLHPSTQSTQYSPSDASFSLDGSAVWVDSGADQTFGYPEKNGSPYATITSPAYIAGVTNPIFESSGSWDLLCDIGSSRMVISKDILITYPVSTGPPPAQLVIRTGTLKAEGSIGSEEEMTVRPSRDLNPVQKAEFVGKADTADNIFMEDVNSILPRSISEAD